MLRCLHKRHRNVRRQIHASSSQDFCYRSPSPRDKQQCQGMIISKIQAGVWSPYIARSNEIQGGYGAATSGNTIARFDRCTWGWNCSSIRNVILPCHCYWEVYTVANAKVGTIRRELQQEYPSVAYIDVLLRRCHVPLDCNLREHIGVIAVLWCGCF